MPHLTLEYSNNVIEKKLLVELFQKLHLLLADNLPTQIASCKSRAIEFAVFTIGKGNSDAAFVHVSLKVLPGRSQSILESTGQHLLKALKQHFAQSISRLKLQISLEISELQSTYKTYTFLSN